MWLALLLQQHTPSTFLKAELIPLAANEKIDTSEENNKVETPATKPADSSKETKRQGRKKKKEAQNAISHSQLN